MNSGTNHVVSLKMMAALREMRQDHGYEVLPDNLQHAAKKALRGRDEVTISRTSGGALSKYAALRREEKRKAARAIQKASRKANRPR